MRTTSYPSLVFDFEPNCWYISALGKKVLNGVGYPTDGDKL